MLGSVQVPGAVGADLVPAVTASTGLPVRIENDTRAEALAEHWFGRGRRASTFVTVQTGDGLGAGFVLDGVIHRGPSGYGGEIGHTAVVHRRRAMSLRQARVLGDRRHAALAASHGSGDGACGGPGSSTPAGSPRSPATTGAPTRCSTEYADHLAIGIANLHQTLGAELFILHGDAAGGGAEPARPPQRGDPAAGHRPSRRAS